MIVCGIETSCDETAVAFLNEERQILSHCLYSQISLHEPYGGVVPEVAARAHLQLLPSLLQQALNQAQLTWQEVDAIAVTAGPGLIGGLLVGVMTAKALSSALNKPFIAVNHLEGHALTVRLIDNVPFPYLLLLVSGGHTQFIVVHDLIHYHFLGGTLDDAVGETFDKVAQLLGLSYPGGPEIEKLAKQGQGSRFPFPRPLLGKQGCQFSFSGLKTAVRLCIEKMFPLSGQDKADIAASFQDAIGDCLVDKTEQAFALAPDVSSYVIAGGVAANQSLRHRLQNLCIQHHKRFIVPPMNLCTDNAIMIAWAGVERLKKGLVHDLNFMARPRWPLAEVIF